MSRLHTVAAVLIGTGLASASTISVPASNGQHLAPARSIRQTTVQEVTSPSLLTSNVAPGGSDSSAASGGVQGPGLQPSQGGSTNLGTCPCAGSPPEGEVGCGIPIDTFNGGCNSTPIIYSVIPFPGSVCGTAAWDLTTRDTDWYLFTLVAPTTVTWTVTAEYVVNTGILDTLCPPTILDFDVGTAPCTATTSTAALAAGTYVVFTAPSFGGPAIVCGTSDDYTGTLSTGTPPPPVDYSVCQYDDGVSELAYTMGATAGEELVWIDRYGAVGDLTYVTSISAAFGCPIDGNASSPNGTPANLVIYDDPNDDGDPSDAVLLQIVPIVTAGNDTDTFVTGALSPPVIVSGAYFVGAGIITPNALEWNAAFDKSVASLGRAWAFGNPGGLADYNVLTNNAILVEMDAFGDPGIWMVRSSCGPVIESLCSPGDSGVIGCPCGNPPSGLDRGCNNHGAFSGGASLVGSGNPSLSNDTLLLSAAGENATALTVFWTGTTFVPAGTVHAAGVRCVTGLKRIYTGSAAGGAIARPMGGPSVSVATGNIMVGQTRYYFTIYRDPNAAVPCGIPASTVNLSNAVSAFWGP